MVCPSIVAKVLQRIPIVQTLATYRRADLRRDLVAGLSVAVVVIPQSMAYALIAGLPPVYGLYTAIVSTIVAGCFGSSHHIVAGPTNAIALLVAGALQHTAGSPTHLAAMGLLGLLTGGIQILLGALRLGVMVDYISHAVILGFAAGAGILIGIGQLNSLLGIAVPAASQLTSLQKLVYVLTHVDSVSPWALGLGVLTILIAVGARRVNSWLPGPLLAVGLCAWLAFVFGLEARGVPLTGAIGAALPAFRPVWLDADVANALLPGATTIAIVGLIEVVSTAKLIAARTHQTLDVDQEFIGQGLGNAVGAFFQCFPGSGSRTRSFLNYSAGGVTRLAAVSSGLLVAVIVVLLAGAVSYIPLASLAGVIMVIAVNMVDVRGIVRAYRVSRSDAAVLAVTAVATLLLPKLEWAVYLGVLLSVALHLRRTHRSVVRVLIPESDGSRRFHEHELADVTPGRDVLIVQLEGNLFFGCAEDLRRNLGEVAGKTRAVVLRMKRVASIDLTALEVLVQFADRLRHAGVALVICGVGPDLHARLMRSDLAAAVGAENILRAESELLSSSAKALVRARELLAGR